MEAQAEPKTVPTPPAIAAIPTITVAGYVPSRGEVALLAQSRFPDGRSEAPSPSPPREKPGVNPREGVLIDQGRAAYGRDPAGSESYYVTLRGADGGEPTHWGVDLERAFQEEANRGGRVSLERLGKRPVAVRRAVRDARGEISYQDEKSGRAHGPGGAACARA